jgi:tetratricopeptide (TPR) repeat protein
MAMEAGRAPGQPLDRGDRHAMAIAQAMAALNGDRAGEAERIAADVLKAEPRHARALYVRGGALLMQGRIHDAIAVLEPAVRGRQDAELDTMLAIALGRAGRCDDALDRLKRATRRQPPYAAAFRELGSLLASLERYDEAIEMLRRGLQVAPMMPELSIELGFALLEQRNCADAKAAFAQALAIAPDSSRALFGMGRAQQELGEAEAAAGLFRRFLMANPNDVGTWLSLGHCLLELGQREAGYECFRTGARGEQQRYGAALASLVKSGRGRFWLKPSDAARFLRGDRSAPA